MVTYKESMVQLKDLVRIYDRNMEQRQTFLNKGLKPEDIDREIENIMNGIQLLTGERSIEYARKVLQCNGISLEY